MQIRRFRLPLYRVWQSKTLSLAIENDFFLKILRLIWVCTVCVDLSARKHRVITVDRKVFKNIHKKRFKTTQKNNNKQSNNEIHTCKHLTPMSTFTVLEHLTQRLRFYGRDSL